MALRMIIKIDILKLFSLSKQTVITMLKEAVTKFKEIYRYFFVTYIAVIGLSF